MGAKFGDPTNPLLVSCRSGARASMPGMMDTVLNIGLNDKTVAGLAKQVGQRALRLGQLPPLRRRCTATSCWPQAGEQGRSRSVRGDRWTSKKKARGVEARHRADRPTRSRSWSPSSRRRSRTRTGKRLPRRPVRAAVRAPSARVRQSWMNDRADRLSPAERHPATSGARPSTCRRWCSATWATTAPPASASRATRPPARTCFYGEYLINAQGEDVVAGIRTPQKIDDARQGACRRPTRSCSTSARSSRSTTRTCRTSSSPSRTASSTCCRRRNGKRTGFAAVRIAVEMVDEKLITKEEALRRVRAGRPEPAAAAGLRLPAAKKAADRRGPPARQGHQRRPGRRHRQGRVLRRRRRGAGRQGRDRPDPRAATRPAPRTSAA